MKRALSCPDSEQTHSHPLSPKRLRKSSDTGHCCLPLDASSRLSRTLPLTPENLQALCSQSTLSIGEWASHDDSFGEPEMGPPTPSVTSNDSSQRRRPSKLSYRRRSQSPSKKTSTQYRSRNMADASVFVDHCHDPPWDVTDQLKHIFGVSMLDDIGHASFSGGNSCVPAIQSTIAELAEKYCCKSRQMTKDCAGEGQWKSHLLTILVEPMQELWPNILKLSASEKPWTSELRPTPPSFEDILYNDSPHVESHQLTTEHQTLPPPLPAQTFPDTPIFSAPSNAPSDVTDDPNRISIPKPDIALGLAHTSFARLQGKILWDLQDNNRVLSGPHQSGVGLHFPFLIIEAKGLATGSNMVGVQNQAAVGGACALNIFRDLKVIATIHVPYTSSNQPKPRQILFSVVTEGPVHEMWVHYQIGEAYHMTVLRIWRTTIRKEAREFVQALGEILKWGVGDLRASVLKELTTIETVLRERRIE